MASSVPILTNETLGFSMVTIYVGRGEKREKFFVHKNLLCKQSKFFSGMFNSRFSEALSDVAELPEDSPEAFQIFINWVYQGTVPDFPNGYFSPRDPGPSKFVNALFKTFCFAEKYCINDLQNCIMDAIQDMHEEYDQEPTKEEFDFVYANTKPDSKLRKYCALIIAWLMENVTLEDTNPPIDIPCFLNGNQELVEDFVKLYNKFRCRLRAGLNPKTRDYEADDGSCGEFLDSCFFHTHKEGEVCHNE